MKPVALQLWSLREQAKQDFVGVLKKVGTLGYAGVEPAGLFGLQPGEVRRIVDDLGMKVCSNHQPWPARDNLQEVIDVASALGTQMVICGFGPEGFVDRQTIEKTAQTANFLLEKLKAAGLTLAVHNHWWEFETLDGRLKYDLFMELCPELSCEIDTYWCANFGANDPAQVVARYRQRAPLLHVKDGSLKKDAPQRPVGFGKLNFPKIIEAADPQVLQWLIVELDDCEEDMLMAVAQSYAYLVENGLAKGRR
jgi:sugar phosphate isomerase/epimerase